MFCPRCDGDSRKFGKTRDGQQRYRCKQCRQTFSEPKPLAGIATDIDVAAKALNMLLEGMSIRATARLTGLDKDTVQRLMEQAGKQCSQFLANAMFDLNIRDIQVDEVWSFVGKKEKTAQAHEDYWEGTGDAYVFTAIDRESKLLICFHVGRRSGEDAEKFAAKLAACINEDVRPHVSTDGFKPYHTTIPDAFDYEVDHGMVIKQFGNASDADQRRYSPPRIIGVKMLVNSGEPDVDRVSTSHVERHNLTIRMQNRRFTRLTNAFSKKWENHEAMFALFAAWYNFCRRHQTLKTTPAVAAGLAHEPWTIEQLLVESAKALAV
jgi:transposase-like protein/IS1 family transposase